MRLLLLLLSCFFWHSLLVSMTNLTAVAETAAQRGAARHTGAHGRVHRASYLDASQERSCSQGGQSLRARQPHARTLAMAPAAARATLALATLALLACNAAAYNAAAGKPIVRVKGNKHRTLLSLDGGVFRGIIISSLLLGVEDIIKEVGLQQRCVRAVDGAGMRAQSRDGAPVRAGHHREEAGPVHAQGGL